MAKSDPLFFQLPLLRKTPLPSSWTEKIDSRPVFSFPLLGSLRRLEWALIVVMLFADLCHRYFAQRSTGPSEWGSTVPFIIVLAALAWLQARDLSKYTAARCLIWIVLQLLLISIATVLGTGAPLFVFNLLLTAKAVLLLRLWGGAVIALANVLILVFFLVMGLRGIDPQSVEFVQKATDDGLGVLLYTACNLIVLFIALAIVREAENRRKMEQLAHENEVLTAELERNRIARDLHDTLGHALVSLGLQLELIREFRNIDAEKANKALDTAHELTDHLITEVRQAVHEIRDPSFDLDRSLRDLVNEVHRNDKLSVVLDGHVNLLPNRVERELFCIAKECLTNVQKHASAANVMLKLQQQHNQVELSVSDDGNGFSSSLSSSGFGLQNIEERVKMLGGKFSIDSSPGGGTKIFVSIPI
jgi:signal transduction histidine kinase